MRRLTIILLLAGLLCGALFVGTAQALTVTGGSSDQQRLVGLVAGWQPGLASFIGDTYPDFNVRICYGGHAWEGSIDVPVTRQWWAFTRTVAHELGHEVQLAADARGLNLGQAWLDELTARGYGPETWIWSNTDPVWKHRRNPWEAFAENMRRAFWSDWCASPTTPDTCLAWLSPDDMRAFLTDNGVF